MECAYTCRIDELGRIVLSKELRAELGWKLRDKLVLHVDDNMLVLRLSEKESPRNEIFCSAGELF